MHQSKVKVVTGPMVFGGWRGHLSIDGDAITIDSTDGTRSVVIDMPAVKRASFNSSNGLWVFRLTDRRKVRFQSAGVLLSADRSDAGRRSNEELQALLARHNVRLFGI